MQVFAALIEGIVNQYLGDNACTDVISSRLLEHCPSLYSMNDAKCSKANELLKTLTAVTSPAERSNRLKSAVKVREKISFSSVEKV